MRRVMLVMAFFGLWIPSASAAQPYCRVITDPAHDDFQNVAVPPDASFGSLDLLSGDVASNATTVTTVVRVRDLVRLEPGSPPGTSYDFIFSIGGSRFLFTAIRDPLGERFQMQIMVESTGSTDNGAATYQWAGLLTGVFDEDRDEIRVHAPARLIRAHSTWGPGSRFENFEISANRQAGTPASMEGGNGAFASADTAFSPKATAKPGSASCVPVGK